MKVYSGRILFQFFIYFIVFLFFPISLWNMKFLDCY